LIIKERRNEIMKNKYMVTVYLTKEYIERYYIEKNKEIQFIEANDIEEAMNITLRDCGQYVDNIFLYEDEVIDDIIPKIKKIIINEVLNEEVVFDNLDEKFNKEKIIWWENKKDERDRQEYERLKKKFE
jgi:hypothetical protein